MFSIPCKMIQLKPFSFFVQHQPNPISSHDHVHSVQSVHRFFLCCRLPDAAQIRSFVTQNILIEVVVLRGGGLRSSPLFVFLELPKNKCLRGRLLAVELVHNFNYNNHDQFTYIHLCFVQQEQDPRLQAYRS